MNSGANSSSNSSPPDRSELIIQLHHSGVASELISLSLRISVEEVNQVLFNDPQVLKAKLEVMLKDSQKYRCSRSGRLMLDPVICEDGKNYELNVLQHAIKQGAYNPGTMIRNSLLKEQIQGFSKQTLRQIEICLSKDIEPEVTMTLFAECLSVLDLNSETEHVLRAIERTTSTQLHLLLSRLEDWMPVEYLRNLLHLLAGREDFQVEALEVCRFFLITHPNSRTYESDFDAFLSLLKTRTLNSEFKSLAKEVMKVSDAPHASRIRSVIFESNYKEKTNSIDGNLAKLKSEGGASDLLIDTLNLLKQLCIFNSNSHEVKPIADEGFMAKLEGMDAKLKALSEDVTRLKDHKVAKAELGLLGMQDYDINEKCKQFESGVCDVVPEFIYSYAKGTGELYWTRMTTGEEYSHTFKTFKFKQCYSWCAVPRTFIYLTGGYQSADVVCIDTRSFVVSPKPSMITPRVFHNSVFSKGYLYIVGGWTGTSSMKECERYSFAEKKWKALPPLITEAHYHSLFMHDTSQILYSLGGCKGSESLNLIQEMNVERLVWRTLSVKLPSTAYNMACFSSGSECYFVQFSKLFVFDVYWNQIRYVKTLPADIFSHNGPSYYSTGTIFASNHTGPVLELDVGSLDS
mmetsp:Transcript_6117/g.10728  ORF Transcript_6117/g.10728 Transcript_6117/m.10728 type:complete len:631 (-) Transcript_6117:106-1998(-)